ncbi:hypothetical protein WN944_001750 [Citrus x changshan-huyou]|uniref:Uncharacterized protein n=1 Tax=Citrus x changshan-huyou TaxID=2935761 RepID=A0AAP0MF92_9ROSI
MRELKHRFSTGLGEDLVWAQRESRLKEVNWVCLLEVQVNIVDEGIDIRKWGRVVTGLAFHQEYLLFCVLKLAQHLSKTKVHFVLSIRSDFWEKNCHARECNKLSHASRSVQQPALLEFSQVSSSRCVGSDLPHHAAAGKSQHSSRSVGSDLPHAAIALSPTAVVIVLLRQFV